MEKFLSLRRPFSLSLSLSFCVSRSDLVVVTAALPPVERLGAGEAAGFAVGFVVAVAAFSAFFACSCFSLSS